MSFIKKELKQWESPTYQELREVRKLEPILNVGNDERWLEIALSVYSDSKEYLESTNLFGVLTEQTF